MFEEIFVFIVKTIEIMKGLLTPLIAVIAAYIAYQQYRLNKTKMKRETYDRNLKVYRATLLFISRIVFESGFGSGSLTQDEVRKFYSETCECRFLFDSKLHQYIDELYMNGNTLVDLGGQIEKLRNKGSSVENPWLDNRMNEAEKINQWFVEEYNLLDSFFAPYITNYK